MKDIINSKKGYIIRFYKESEEKAYFFGHGARLMPKIDYALIFETEAEAAKAIIDNKARIKKSYKRGYLYIAKIFHGKCRATGRNTIKLTKPDRHDFLESI
jgi:hypothetical protein